MNEPNNQSSGGFGDTFSSQPAAPGTNPFTADLKGEFTSNFGTNTNAVSQIFKEGSFAGQNKTKYFIIGGVVLVVVAILAFALFPSDEEEEGAAETASEEGSVEEGAEDSASTSSDSTTAESTTASETPKEGEGESETTAEQPVATEAASDAAPKAAKSSEEAPMAGGPISLGEPADGSSLNYDESQGPAMFSWSGGGGYIVFSRNASMSPAVYRVRVSGNQYAFHHPWPGTWYWKVENASGSTEIRSFKVNGPQRRNLQITEPANGAVAGNGGVIAWQGDNSVAYYRVELSNGGWANPTHRFATSGNSVRLEGVSAGTYQMRIGAFSEVSGRFEYTAPASVTVQ